MAKHPPTHVLSTNPMVEPRRENACYQLLWKYRTSIGLSWWYNCSGCEMEGLPETSNNWHLEHNAFTAINLKSSRPPSHGPRLSLVPRRGVVTECSDFFSMH